MMNHPSQTLIFAGICLQSWTDTSQDFDTRQRYSVQAIYPSNTRATGTRVELLKQFITTTGRTPRYLRTDNAKEFTSQELVDFCSDHSIILQPAVTCNHTMQARVEGAIG